MDDMSLGAVAAEPVSYETAPRWTPAPDMPPLAPLDMPIQPFDQPHVATRKADVLPGLVRRRAIIGAATLVMTILAWWATYDTIALGGVTRLEAVCLVLLAPLFMGLSLWFCTAVAGFVILLGEPKDALGIDQSAPLPEVHARTAILMPVHNEDAAGVFARLRAMDVSLAQHGASRAFDIFVLSDTREPAIALAEQSQFVRFRREASSAVYYRLRQKNVGRKAGNLADWLRNHGGAYEHMIVLDADSLMTGESMIRLADAMERNPGVGLIQTMPVIVNGRTIFARCLQFATRLYGRVAWTGLAWWSGSESGYWGHNAIVRLKAFAETCGLPDLKGRRPFGGEVMSHDALESALLRRGGWTVRLAPYLEGSYEESPPNLLDFAARDRRWCQGNVQHAPLIGLPGLHWLSRVHLFIGILSYLLSPLWFFALMSGIVSRALLPNLKHASFDWADVRAAAHALVDWKEIQATAWAFLITAMLLYGPKLMGAFLIVRRKADRERFGGGRKLVASLSLEMLLSALVAPLLMFTQTRAMAEILIGRHSGWAGQRREVGKIGWDEALGKMGWISTVGLSLAAAFWFTPDLLTATAPILAGLILAAPLAVLGGSAQAGDKVRGWGLFETPDERSPPVILRQAMRAVARPAAPVREWPVGGREPAMNAGAGVSEPSR